LFSENSRVKFSRAVLPKLTAECERNALASPEGEGGVPLRWDPPKHADPRQGRRSIEISQTKTRDAQIKAKLGVNGNLNFSLLKPRLLVALSFSSPSAGL
jgi:hypothetical protein